MISRSLYTLAFVFAMMAIVLPGLAVAQFVVDFNNPSDLVNNFNSNAPAFTNVGNGGISGSGSVYIDRAAMQEDLWTCKVALANSSEIGTVFTVSAYFLEPADPLEIGVGNAGFAGLGFAIANTNDIQSDGCTIVGLGMVTHGGGGYFYNNMSTASPGYGHDLAMNSWYKIIFSVTVAGVNTYDLKFRIYTAAPDGAVGALFTEQNQYGVLNTNFGGAGVIYPYFTASGTTPDGRMANVDNFVIGNEVLPVQLSSFRVAAQSGSSIELGWTTVSEMNNYGFYVQSKPAGENAFADIAGLFIAGHGTTIGQNEYSQTIPGSPVAGTMYRLRQVDLDGTVHFSEAVTLNVTDVAEVAPVVFGLEQNYPNPFNPTTDFTFAVARSGLTTLSVYNALGQEVGQVFAGAAEAGKYYTVRFNAHGLSSGVYYARLQSGNEIQMRKIVLMK